jgi:hypothetical protein
MVADSMPLAYFAARIRPHPPHAKTVSQNKALTIVTACRRAISSMALVGAIMI